MGTPPEPPSIPIDERFVLDAHRPEDAAAHRVFGIDPAAARYFGWTVEQASSQPDSHYDEAVTAFLRDWADGTRFALVIRRCHDGEAVGTVELRPKGSGEADVSYLVTAELRGRGLAPKALAAMLNWAAAALDLRVARLACHVDNEASRRVAEKCGFELVDRQGEELRFRRDVAPVKD